MDVRRRHALSGLIVAAAIGLGTGDARAQTDLGAGKNAAQLFAANCSACHRSAAGLARGRSVRYLARFLLQHYTTRPANASAIARYLTRVRPAPRVRPAARPPEETPPAGQPAAAVRTPPPRPLKPLPKATVERLRNFAVSADAAKPSDGTTPERGEARIAAYAGIGVAAQSLHDTAVDAALRDGHGDARAGLPERGPPVLQAGGPSSTAAGAAEKPAERSAESVDRPSRPAAATDVLPRHGPPARGAMPSVQSNEDTL